MRHHVGFAVQVGLLALLPAVDAGARGAHPTYPVAPGTPVCSAGDPLVCAWSGNGLAPPPVRYAVEAIAAYDPDCADGADSSATFSFTTADADPLIGIALRTLDRTVCTSQDDPCTTSVTDRAASVQIRVKALDPPSRSGAQNNPFSAVSTAVAIPGVCAAACPQACADAMDTFFAQMSAARAAFGITSTLFCSYDSNWQAGTISYGGYTATGVLPVTQGSALIGVAYCLASINGVDLVNLGLPSAEQAACATRFAPAFADLAQQACGIDPP
jgi:hypothetical protein